MVFSLSSYLLLFAFLVNIVPSVGSVHIRLFRISLITGGRVWLMALLAHSTFSGLSGFLILFAAFFPNTTDLTNLFLVTFLGR